MAFEGLANKLQETLKKLRGSGKLNEKDVKEAMREVKMALLEADVNFKVVKDFVSRVTERAVAHEVMESLTPGQQVIKIVNEELTALMGDKRSDVVFNSSGVTVFLIVGLQGGGKTTTAGKLALHYKKQGKHPLLVAADIYRPAAVQQLEVLAKQIDVPFFALEGETPVTIAVEAVEYSRSHGQDLVIIDTAGRLHVDEELMEELQEMKDAVAPQEIFLIVDSMIGQDAVNIAKTFHEELGLTGVILTKLDGDTRGGAALSVRKVTGCPIKFVGSGEKLDALDPFYPDRMSARILGMGDVLSLIEKAQANVDQEKAKELERKLRTQEFTLDDFLDQIKQVRSMGPLEELLGMIPGLGGAKQLRKIQDEVDEKDFVYLEAIINSMTLEERNNPNIIKSSRRKRIALGSGRSVQDVNKLLKSFEQSRKLFKQLSEMGTGKGSRKLKSMKFPFM
ncbi:MAG TPA: signal recognition particle protein [Peptococcaceae bacterium]|nr:signal recognition particle protein [Peptococcaceae bacterium]